MRHVRFWGHLQKGYQNTNQARGTHYAQSYAVIFKGRAMHEGNYADPARKLCCLCQREPKSGSWELCDGCRSQLAAKNRQIENRACFDACLNCCVPRPTTAPPGVYCRKCKARWGGRS